MNKQEFIKYLETTLIPDLVESGHDATAGDFLIAVKFLVGADYVDPEEVEAELTQY